MQTTVDIRELQERIERESSFVDALTMGMNQVIVGQKHLVESLLIGLLSDGHILLEGVPGLAKTLAIKTLADLIKADFSRIQFTPDLLPADVLGTQIYSQKTEEFHIKKGPIFANFVLADEINRAPAKVQSALLEAMQERQITIGEETFKLDDPFLVLATQNPIEQEGTYPLPEAQTDRFMLKVVIGYPKKEEEQQIIRQNISGEKKQVLPILSTEDIRKARNVVNEVYLDEKIEKYIVTHLQSESDKILIVDGSYGKLRVSLCWTGGARVLPLWCRGAALSGTDVFSMSIQCFKFLINPNSPYDNIYYPK